MRDRSFSSGESAGAAACTTSQDAETKPDRETHPSDHLSLEVFLQISLSASTCFVMEAPTHRSKHPAAASCSLDCNAQALAKSSYLVSESNVTALLYAIIQEQSQDMPRWHAALFAKSPKHRAQMVQAPGTVVSVVATAATPTPKQPTKCLLLEIADDDFLSRPQTVVLQGILRNELMQSGAER